MVFITVTCPECGYMKVVNARGRCRCGVYLIGYISRRSGPIPINGRTYVWTNDRWVKSEELRIENEA